MRRKLVGYTESSKCDMKVHFFIQDCILRDSKSQSERVTKESKNLHILNLHIRIFNERTKIREQKNTCKEIN